MLEGMETIAPATEAREWWEKRRLFFNMFAAGCALVGFILLVIVTSLPGMLKPGEDAVEPMGLLCGAMMFPVVVNAAYTAGPPAERHMAKRFPGCDWASILLRLGLGLTAFVFLLPGLMNLVVYLVKH